MIFVDSHGTSMFHTSRNKSTIVKWGIYTGALEAVVLVMLTLLLKNIPLLLTDSHGPADNLLVAFLLGTVIVSMIIMMSLLLAYPAYFVFQRDMKSARYALFSSLLTAFILGTLFIYGIQLTSPI